MLRALFTAALLLPGPALAGREPVGNIPSMGAIVPKLAATHTVYALELQGHGRTTDIDRPITYPNPAARGGRAAATAQRPAPPLAYMSITRSMARRQTAQKGTRSRVNMMQSTCGRKYPFAS